jgi:anti-sigma factor RsiW
MSENEALLVAYADGELDPEAAAGIEKLLEEDPQARRQVEIYRETAALLRAACSERVYATEGETLVPPPRPSLVRHRARRYGAALGLALAACVVGFVGGTQWARGGPSDDSAFASEVAEYHAVFSQEDKHLVEVSAERAAEIITWLGNRLDRTITIPDLSAEGLRFAGARMLVFDGRPVAQFMYTRADGRPIGFCITRSAEPPSSLEVEGHEAERTAVWRDGRFAYVVVGEVGEAGIRRIAADAARQIQG